MPKFKPYENLQERKKEKRKERKKEREKIVLCKIKIKKCEAKI